MFLFYLNESVSSKVLQLNSSPYDNKVMLQELLFKDPNSFVLVSIKKSQNDEYSFQSKSLGEPACQYDKTMLTGEFNVTTDNKNREISMNAFNLECLINKPIVSNMKIRHA